MNKNNDTYSEQINIYLILGLLLLCYGIFGLNGYGNIDSTYGLLNSWRWLIDHHRYVPSRFQGYLIPEIVVGFSSQIGSFYLSNFISSILSVSTLFTFYLLLRKITLPLIAILAIIAIGTNPYWIVASSTSMDFIYSTFFFTLGLFVLLKQKLKIAGLFFAFATSSRMTYAPMVMLVFIIYFIYINKEKPELKKSFLPAIVLFIFTSSILYLPVFIASGMNFSFLDMADVFDPLADLARFVYKNIYFWGLLTFLVLLLFFLQERKSFLKLLFTNPLRNAKSESLIFQGVFLGFIYQQMLFFKLPHQYYYLLPILLLIVYLVIAVSSSSKKTITCLTIIFSLNLLYSLVFNVDILDTHRPKVEQGNYTSANYSTGADLRLSIKKGILIKDFEWRALYQKDYVDDFNKNWRSSGFQLNDPRLFDIDPNY
jgi:hypothetical protein